MVHDNRNLDKYIAYCGSRYAATIFLGQKARKLAEAYDNLITHAEALSWILSGEVPQGVQQYSDLSKRRSQRYLQNATEYLKRVSDIQVRDAVLSSIKKSKSSGHLVYVYGDVYAKERQSRIRIITNKLWYELQEQDCY